MFIGDYIHAMGKIRKTLTVVFTSIKKKKKKKKKRNKPFKFLLDKTNWGIKKRKEEYAFNTYGTMVLS